MILELSDYLTGKERKREILKQLYFHAKSKGYNIDQIASFMGVSRRTVLNLKRNTYLSTYQEHPEIIDLYKKTNAYKLQDNKLHFLAHYVNRLAKIIME